LASHGSGILTLKYLKYSLRIVIMVVWILCLGLFLYQDMKEFAERARLCNMPWVEFCCTEAARFIILKSISLVFIGAIGFLFTRIIDGKRT
jgi:hypothetical protein